MIWFVHFFSSCSNVCLSYWLHLFLPVDIECGFPASISNGHYSLNNGSSRAFLSTLTYHCKDGYVLVGRATLACDADGRWNGPPPRCEPVLCPQPPMIVNGGFSLSNNNSTMFGSAVEYSCEPGFELIGERVITCNLAGYWDAQPGYCLGKQTFMTFWLLFT